MNEIANQLAQSLFKKNSLQECSRWELEILADKYPYFGIAQFLLAGKLKQEDAEAYKKQVQKTSLYFTNPLWLDYTLNNEASQHGEVAIPENSVSTPTFEGTHIPAEEMRFAPKVDEPVVQEEIVSEPIEAETFSVPESGTEPAIEAAPEPIFIETAHEDIPEEVPLVVESIPEIQEEQNSDGAKEEVSTSAEEDTQTGTIDELKKTEPSEPEMRIAPLKVEPMPAPDAPLIFEAFHTVDYFASQGIKLKLDDVPKDRFGQQLKSFTEWLKTLKKNTPTEISKQVDKSTEEKVITLAEHSIENPDVLTETMAEVWLKQGNRQKAIEVYNKLSLQNPAKSSYFAALIEQLKQR